MNGRPRRRPAGRIGVAVAAVVVVGGGAYGIAHVDRGDPGPVTAPPATSESEPSESAGVPPPLPPGNIVPIEPGTYRMLVGFDPAGAKIKADLTITNWQWHSSGQPVVSAGDIWAGIGVYQPIALAGVAPCSGDWRSRPASGSPQALARQLGRLPRSRVIEPLTPTEAFGHDAIHLRLRVDDQCTDEYYQIAKTSAGRRGTPAASRGISYGSTPKCGPHRLLGRRPGRDHGRGRHVAARCRVERIHGWRHRGPRLDQLRDERVGAQATVMGLITCARRH